MANFATVTYDAARDFAHIRYKPVVLQTADDVARWAAEIDVEMSRIGKKVDIIIDLGELVVRAAAASLYDEARLKMFAKFARHAYRYSGSSVVRTKILTSSALHGQTANVFSTFDQALAAMLAERQAKPAR